MLTKFKNIVKEVNGIAKEREEFINLLTISMLAKWNLFAYGDTGQAKSFIINEFRKRIEGAKQFSIQITKQTDLEEIFGRLDIQSVIEPCVKESEEMRKMKEKAKNLIENKKYKEAEEELEKYKLMKDVAKLDAEIEPKIVIKNKAADAHYIILDEVFDGNDSTLRGLNTAMNERQYTNEGTTLDIPAEVFVAASNRVPDLNDPEDNRLKAMYDRFHFKTITNYITDEKNALDVIKNKKEENLNKSLKTITLDEIHKLQKEVKKVLVTDDLDEIVWNIVQELRRKDIHVSDRKFLNYFPAAQAIAFLDGRKQCEAKDLMILKNMFWNKPEEIETVEAVVKQFTENLMQTKINELLSMGMECYEQTINVDVTDLVKKTKQLKKFRTESIKIYDMVTEAAIKGTTEKDKKIIKEAITKLEKYNKKVHDKFGYTYAPLTELKMLI